ncbi:septation ring formation regulator EzrA [Brevibacillus sp. B_LB10_24]|uniref:septation ring formation regulator EzrA n=1 Tax=Brevibacillus sp. B_LB10_24 TaxID=3380645 RepID=UPI0038B95901
MKQKILLLVAAGILCFSHAVEAAPFPEKTDAVVQDATGSFQQQDRQNFADYVSQLTGEYKVVVVKSTKPEADSPDAYAGLLYDNYNVSEDTLMIVLDMETQELGVHPGPAFEAKGATMDMLHQMVKAYYEPYRNQKRYLPGIELFVTEVNRELDQIAAGKGTMGTPGSEDPAAPPEDAKKAEDKHSLWSIIPWWAYLIVLLIVAGIVAMIFAFARRRRIYFQVDDVEDWKDELVEKINAIDLEKSLRHAAGSTEEWYTLLINRKENLLRIRIPDVEMIILDAEEACYRMRFGQALDLLDEGRELLETIEAELNELKTETAKVATAKKENKAAIPEIGKLLESVERKLTNVRLDYGLSFHEMKAAMDEAEKRRSEVKRALASGDELKAYEISVSTQQQLTALSEALEKLPELYTRVNKELPEDLKQLENDIMEHAGSGYDLGRSYLDDSLLQVKQLLIAAKSAFEEGNVQLVETHIKAFEIKREAVYRSLEESALQQREAAAAAAVQAAPDQPVEKVAPGALEEVREEATGESEVAEPVSADEVEAEAPPVEPAVDTPAADLPHVPEEPAIEEPAEEEMAEEPAEAPAVLPREEAPEIFAPGPAVEREAAPADRPAPRQEKQPVARPAETTAGEAADEFEYELVMPKASEPAFEPEPPAEKQALSVYHLILESEDDVLDEMERISGSLVRIRQQIKRSYLPGVPASVLMHFDSVVQALGRVQIAMERYNYSMDEIAILLREANEELRLTEKSAKETISYCQKAEGAIQYTNRYRRHNRKVDELLGKAELAFRDLRFQEAMQLAEEARLVVEGEQEEEPVAASRWLLRKKQKGAGN